MPRGRVQDMTPQRPRDRPGQVAESPPAAHLATFGSKRKFMRADVEESRFQKMPHNNNALQPKHFNATLSEISDQLLARLMVCRESLPDARIGRKQKPNAHGK